jgi:hypothetical protein
MLGQTPLWGIDVEEEIYEVDTRGTALDSASGVATGACRLSCLCGTVERAFLLFLAI